ncbi:hypothetical protein EUGRSUZ_L01953 [Eucalyptus grandis]|uniref:Uncharacterized protein n=1 Tax=Eucalyptus grandis TaxID=71139 RepID=A0A058ZRW5_EUCGR|nr:hypothetical protein EUGRSUZ_L01953 [Eucalyptus grandis]
MGDSNTRRNFPELFKLVRDDFPNGLHILYFCATLENCLKYAHNAQLLIFNALHCFEEEDRNGDSRYSNTLEKLRNFRKTGDPLTEFFKIFQIIHKQKKSMFEKLQIKKKEIDTKLKNIQTWAKVSNMILVTTFEAILIYSVMTAAVFALPIATALVAAAAFPMDLVGKWIDSLWKNYEKRLMEQREVITSMQASTFVALMDLDTLRILIDHLEVQIKSLLHKADFVIEEGAEALKLEIADIKKKMRHFMKDVEELEKQADMCFRGL